MQVGYGPAARPRCPCSRWPPNGPSGSAVLLQICFGNGVSPLRGDWRPGHVPCCSPPSGPSLQPDTAPLACEPAGTQPFSCLRPFTICDCPAPLMKQSGNGTGGRACPPAPAGHLLAARCCCSCAHSSSCAAAVAPPVRLLRLPACCGRASTRGRCRARHHRRC